MQEAVEDGLRHGAFGSIGRRAVGLKGCMCHVAKPHGRAVGPNERKTEFVGTLVFVGKPWYLCR